MKIFDLKEAMSLISYHKELEKSKFNIGLLSEKELHNSLVLIDKILEDFKVVGDSRNG